ncbi:MAG: methylmalonyl-CoA mutase [Acidobacteria bacterium]|nr:MAG: methylmalonyl-CoA mutase [Acidobacteriota bacterium]
MDKTGVSERRFTTLSGVGVEPFYEAPPPGDLPPPGEFPYTRGIHRDMYRGKLWTMRQFSGFATPEETNARYHYLLSQGQTGLSVAFDLPTLMGYDADDPLSEGEVGKCGAPVSSLEDMQILLRGLPLDQISLSMTINSPAAVVWAMYLAVAEQQGVEWAKLTGTLQNDILKEYIAQKEFIYPPRPSMRLVTDTIEFGARHTPRFNPISISGYHIREAGSTAVQELAFTLRDGVEYVEWALERGLDVDEFAPRLSFFFNAHNDVFEEVAKYRAARVLWAETLRDKYGARQEASWKLRFQLQAMAAVLGGAQSLHTNSLDEAYALPGEHAVTLALRTQQVIAHESGITAAPDPLGGSFFLEHLTCASEQAARDYIRRIDETGGMIAAIEQGFPQREIAEASYRYQREVETGDKIIVGVNAFQSNDDEPIEILQIDRTAHERQVNKLAALRKRRDRAQVTRSLDGMPYILEAVRAYATLGEICNALRDVFGAYQEPSTV